MSREEAARLFAGGDYDESMAQTGRHEKRFLTRNLTVNGKGRPVDEDSSPR
jgi:hypothetical protein